MEKLASFFKVLGDSTRLKILQTLMKSDKSVGTIATDLDMTVSAISHQLRVLKDHGLVKGTKDGKEVIYSLDDHHVHTILEMGHTHLSEVKYD